VTEHVFIDCDDPTCSNVTSLESDDLAHWLDFGVIVGFLSDGDEVEPVDAQGHACSLGCLPGAMAQVAINLDLVKADDGG
jgi:hypothetical protein